MRNLILAILLTGCAEQQVQTPLEEATETSKKVTEALYKPGQCLFLVDPENDFKGKEKDALRVDEVTPTEYVYRWWVFNKEWAVGTNRRPHKSLERITKKLNECPK